MHLRTLAAVVLAPAAVVVGLVAGRLLLRRPLRYRHLGPPRVGALPILVLGVALVVVADRLDSSAAVAVAVAGQATLVVGVLANGHLVGTGVLAVGLALNLVSMTVDGGMPVRRGALVHAGVLGADEVAGASLSGPRHLERDDDLVPGLGDVLPLRPVGTVVSFGDLVILTGLADIAAHAARPRRHRRRGRRSEPETVVIDLRAHVRSDDELEAMLRHPTARSSANPAHDWGTAPPAVAVSGSHHSASPEVRAPATVGAATADAPAPVPAPASR